MKKYLLFLSVLLSNYLLNAQKLTFGYDLAGNQISRTLCVNCNSKPAKEIKEISALQEEDLLQFSHEDQVSYYPNPVREELYLSWQTSANKYVAAIKVFSVTGQVLLNYQGSSKANNYNIAFQSYPSGIYLVLLSYSDGEEKTIKIIKQ
ncbi:T9SS type A sorting domain-containing protein [Flavobacterium bizetiae]|uniref:T9SS type A sorting domain-containing protein n=1 Tax=Flavobacterium bizetiae TaxID=2704140 RepID=UPI003756767A